MWNRVYLNENKSVLSVFPANWTSWELEDGIQPL